MAIERVEWAEMVSATDSKQLATALEMLVDKFTLASVLMSLSEIADGKAEHLSTNWQDDLSAKVWQRAARQTETLAHKTNV